jgi:hypothetical protein
MILRKIIKVMVLAGVFLILQRFMKNTLSGSRARAVR